MCHFVFYYQSCEFYYSMMLASLPNTQPYQDFMTPPQKHKYKHIICYVAKVCTSAMNSLLKNDKKYENK